MRPLCVIFFISILFFACYGDKKTFAKGEAVIIADSTKQISATSKGNTLIEHLTGYDTLLKEENLIVLGNKILEGKEAISYIETKFKQYVHFDDFNVDTLFNRTQAQVDFSSNPDAKRFKTVITKTYLQDGLTFGGHYCFVEWGCGSPCQSSVIIDLNTGKIYNGVSASFGYQYRKDSRLLIVNPTSSSGYYLDCPYCEPLIYVWNEQSKKFEQRN